MHAPDSVCRYCPRLVAQKDFWAHTDVFSWLVGKTRRSMRVSRRNKEETGHESGVPAG